jgi:multisubunit Na+/H+ antiporter MnhF subunit
METTDQNGEQTKRFKGPGGTPGGVGTFLLGLAMTIAGAYLIMNQVQVTSGYWMWWGPNTFGLTLVPLMIGIGLLFFNGKSLAGRLLVGAGLVIIFAGIIANLSIYFRQTSLYNALIMLALFAGGLGLIARSLKSYESKNESPDR